MGFPRDSQRTKVYTAEGSLPAVKLGSIGSRALALKIISNADVKRAVGLPDVMRAAERMNWDVFNHPAGLVVSVNLASNSCAAHLRHGTFFIPGRQETTNAFLLAHAFAHLVTPARGMVRVAGGPKNPAVATALKKGQPVAGFDNQEGRAWHCPAFCVTYLGLVQWMADRGYINHCAPHELREAFRAHKVKTRTVSKEARDSARERWYARQENNLEADLAALRDRLMGSDG